MNSIIIPGDNDIIFFKNCQFLLYSVIDRIFADHFFDKYISVGLCQLLEGSLGQIKHYFANTLFMSTISTPALLCCLQTWN